MKKAFGFWSAVTLALVALTAFSATTGAQRSGGGGGGGNARHGGRYSLIFDYAPEINGRAPVCRGTYGLTTYITTLSLDIRVSSCNLPDGTPLTVTAYANDYYNGTPWEPKVAGTMTVSGGSCALTASSVWTTPAGGLPTLTSVVVTDPNGNVVLSGHP